MCVSLTNAFADSEWGGRVLALYPDIVVNVPVQERDDTGVFLGDVELFLHLVKQNVSGDIIKCLDKVNKCGIQGSI